MAEATDDLSLTRELDDAGMPRAMRREWPEARRAEAEAALGDATDDELAAMRGEAVADIRLNPLKISSASACPIGDPTARGNSAGDEHK